MLIFEYIFSKTKQGYANVYKIEKNMKNYLDHKHVDIFHSHTHIHTEICISGYLKKDMCICTLLYILYIVTYII